MIWNLKLILYGIAVVAVISILAYGRHIYKEAQRVDGLVATINTQRTQIENERTQAAKALEFGNEIQKRLDASRLLNDRLSQRLRRALTVELSAPPANPSVTPPASGDGELPSVFDSVNRVLAACQRDAIRLNSWIEYYRNAPAELK